MNKKVPVLPKEAYLSQQWFDEEQKHIFSKTWQFAGFAGDVIEDGSYTTVQAGLFPILVINNKGTLQAFHNICRHRGTPLLAGKGTVGSRMVCPYHYWSYDLNGQLRGVPERKEEFADLDIDTICLHSASVDVWRSMLWVHSEPGATPASEWFEQVLPHLGPHQPEKLQEFPDYSTRHEISANWKIIVENFMDVYHLKYLHQKTLYMYDHANAKYGWAGPHYWFYEPLSKRHKAELPLIDHIPKDKMGAYVPMLFPNLGLAETESAWSTFHVIPVGPDKSIVETRTRAMPSKGPKLLNSAMSWLYSSKDKSNSLLNSGDFMEEDIYVCEGIQKGMSSPSFSVDHTAKHGESTVRNYQTKVLEFLKWSPK